MRLRSPCLETWVNRHRVITMWLWVLHTELHLCGSDWRLSRYPSDPGEKRSMTDGYYNSPIWTGYIYMSYICATGGRVHLSECFISEITERISVKSSCWPNLILVRIGPLMMWCSNRTLYLRYFRHSRRWWFKSSSTGLWQRVVMW
jgi:hypothetical protein